MFFDTRICGLSSDIANADASAQWFSHKFYAIFLVELAD